MNTENSNHIFHGAITDVHMWNRSLTDSELEDWTGCGAVPPGDLINWETVDLSRTGLELQTVDIGEICEMKTKKSLMAAFNRKLNFLDSAKFCSSVGEVVSGLEDNELEEMIGAVRALEEPVCSTTVISTGMIWSEEVRSWTDFNTGRRVTVENWYPDRPSNDTDINNCLFVFFSPRKFYDISCTDYHEVCPICRVTKV